jgi:hypothetical protein
MDRIAELVQRLEPETIPPSEEVKARQREALVTVMAQVDGEYTPSRSKSSPSRRWFVAIAGAAAVVLVVTFVISRSSPSPTPRGGTPALLLGITRALANASDDIEEVHSSASAAPLSATSWVDQSAGKCRTDISLDGRPSLSVFLDRGTAVLVDYDHQEWSMRSAEGVTCESLTPQVIAQDLAEGRYTVAGQAIVLGKPALKLVSLSSTGGSHSVMRLTSLWVDRTNYLPIESTSTGHLTEQTYFSWLPPTSMNRAPLNVTIPGGFHQVPNLAPGILVTG